MHQHKAPRSIYEDRPDALQGAGGGLRADDGQDARSPFPVGQRGGQRSGSAGSPRDRATPAAFPLGYRRRAAAGWSAGRPAAASFFGHAGHSARRWLLADMDRETIKGQSASRARRRILPHRFVPTIPMRAVCWHKERPEPMRKAEPLKSGELRRAQALPKANELGDDPASALFAAGIGSDPKLARDLVGQRLTTGKKSAAQADAKVVLVLPSPGAVRRLVSRDCRGQAGDRRTVASWRASVRYHDVLSAARINRRLEPRIGALHSHFLDAALPRQ